MTIQADYDKDFRFQKFGLFRNIVLAVWIVLFVYVGYYYYLGAKLAFAAVALGAFVFSPILFYKSSTDSTKLTKFLFILSCNFYIYTSGLGFEHQILAEYYYLPAAMLPLLFYDLTEKKYVFAGVITPFSCWLLTKFVGSSFLPGYLLYTDASSRELIKNIN
ncbi:MAG: hypothetical protein ABL930_08745, partial [Pseudobdellovibrio sp.]